MSTTTTPGLADLEDVRLEMLATLEALAIELATHGLMGAAAKYEQTAARRARARRSFAVS